MEHRSESEEGKKSGNSEVMVATGRGAVGGVAGLLVFGGALAVTGVIAVAASFAANKNKAKGPPPNKPPPQQSHDPSPHIPSLQDPTPIHHNACFETSNTSKHQIDSYEVLPCQTLILEEKPDLKVKTYVEEKVTSRHQEIVLSDDSPPESTVSSIDNEIEEEFVESSNDSPCFKDVDQRESEELLKSVEINEGQHDNANSEIVEREDDIVEENDDVAFETSGNSSEATGMSSLDSNEAAIWPSELIEKEPQQVKGEIVNDESEAEWMIKSNIYRRFVKSEKANLLYVAMNHHLSVSKFKTWVITLLLCALLLLVLLTLRNRISGSSYASGVDGGNSIISL